MARLANVARITALWAGLGLAAAGGYSLSSTADENDGAVPAGGDNAATGTAMLAGGLAIAAAAVVADKKGPAAPLRAKVKDFIASRQKPGR